MKINVNNIPALLRDAAQWVVWRYEVRDGKPTKPPYQATGEPASHTNKSTWDTFGNVYSAYSEGGWEGIGFALADTDPLAGIDLDHCVANGSVEPWAQSIIDRMGSYTEISPSGTGVRIFLRGVLPDGAPRGGRKINSQGTSGAGAVELYCRLRYLTVTGQHLDGTPLEIREANDAFQALYKELFPLDKPKQKSAAQPTPGVPQDDNELLARMFGSKTGAAILHLWNGGLTNGSHSEADAALCTHLAWWCGKDEVRIDRLFRQSRLMRDKWDEQRGDSTYGERTIELALQNMGETYEGPAQTFDISDLEQTRREEAAATHYDALGAAQALAGTLADALKKDPGCIYEGEWPEALGLLRALDAANWTRVKATLQRFRLSLRDVERALPPVEKYLPVEVPEMIGAGAYASHTLPGCPAPALLIPPPYFVREGATGRMVLSDCGKPLPRNICNAPVLILGRAHSITTGDEFLLLGTKWPRGGWISRMVPREQASTARELLKLSRCGFPVADDNKGDLVTYLRILADANQPELPCARVTHHLGWQGDSDASPFLCGSTIILPNGEVQAVDALDVTRPESWHPERISYMGNGDGQEQLVDGFQARGSLDGWLKTVSVLPHYPKALFVFYAGLAAPLLSLWNIPNFIVDLAHETTVGKTTALRAAASHWGNPDERSPSGIVLTWDATRVGVERASEVVTHLPLFVDDTKKAKHPKAVADLIYAVTSGRGRVRGTIGGLAKTATWRTIMFSTGEQAATSFTQDGGTRTRVLALGGMPFGEQSAALGAVTERLNGQLLDHHGHAGPLFVSWLLKNRDTWDAWRERYRSITAHLVSTAGSPESGRLAPYVALVSIVGEMAHRALALPWEFVDPTPALWQELASGAADAAGSQRALDDILSWASSHELLFLGRIPSADLYGSRIPPTVLGRWDPGEEWEYLAIYPTVLNEALEKLGYSAHAIKTSWRERGYLRHRPGKFTWDVPVGGDGIATKKMVCILRSAFEGLEGGGA